jgi:hypothetical protein
VQPTPAIGGGLTMPVYKCKHPTCRAQLPERGHCARHQPAAAEPEREKKEKDRLYDASRRDPEMVKFYNSAAWKAVRLEKLRQDPLCQMCNKAVATTVHHKDPAKGQSPAERLNIKKLESACSPCHSRHEWRKTHGQDSYQFTQPDWDQLARGETP